MSSTTFSVVRKNMACVLRLCFQTQENGFNAQTHRVWCEICPTTKAGRKQTLYAVRCPPTSAANLATFDADRYWKTQKWADRTPDNGDDFPTSWNKSQKGKNTKRERGRFEQAGNVHQKIKGGKSNQTVRKLYFGQTIELWSKSLFIRDDCKCTYLKMHEYILNISCTSSPVGTI